MPDPSLRVWGRNGCGSGIDPQTAASPLPITSGAVQFNNLSTVTLETEGDELRILPIRN